MLNISGDAVEIDFSGVHSTAGASLFRLGTPSGKKFRPGAHSQEVQTPKTPSIETAL